MFEAKLDIAPEYRVSVHTTQFRGHTPEEIASRCADKIMRVSINAPPVIREQAFAFKEQLENILSFYMREAITSDRTTVFNALNDAGHPELAELIRRL